MSIALIKGQRHRRVWGIVALMLMGGLLLQWQRASGRLLAGPGPDTAQAAMAQNPSAAFAATNSDASQSILTPELRAEQDPVKFFEHVIDQYDRTVRDYTCVFTKQERLAGKLGKRQVIRALYRENPFSVRLEWLENEDKCSRVLYVEDRWVQDEQQMAVAEPGVIARLFVRYVMRPIHGADAKKSSRRTIDQFGVRNAMELTLKYCRLAEKQGELDFRYVGHGELNDRETLVFERRLPYENEQDIWPDRVQVVHVDRELLFLVQSESYADDAKTVLLGSYGYSDMKINVNHADSVFTKKGMGL